MILNADNDNLKELYSEGFSIVDFYCEHCGPCKLLAPILDKIESEFPFVNIIKVNTDACPNYSNEYEIKAVPTILFVKDGEIKERRVGVMYEAQIKDKIAQYMYD